MECGTSCRVEVEIGIKVRSVPTDSQTVDTKKDKELASDWSVRELGERASGTLSGVGERANRLSRGRDKPELSQRGKSQSSPRGGRETGGEVSRRSSVPVRLDSRRERIVDVGARDGVCAMTTWWDEVN